MSILKSTNIGSMGIPMSENVLIERGYTRVSKHTWRFKDNPLNEIQFKNGPKGMGWYADVWFNLSGSLVQSVYHLKYLEMYWEAKDSEEMKEYANLAVGTLKENLL